MRPTDYFSRQIAFHREFVTITNSVTAALFLSQALYWSKKTDWQAFFKTQEEWTEETGLSRAEQEAARKKLRDLGVLEERYDRLAHRMYYKLNQDRLDHLLQANIPECGNSAVGTAEIQQSYSESEITEEISPISPKGTEDFFSDTPPASPPKPAIKTPTMLRLEKLYRRRESTLWSKDEMKFFKAIGEIPNEEIVAVERHYAAMAKTPDKDYRKRELQRLLRNWRGVVDAAFNFKPANCF